MATRYYCKNKWCMNYNREVEFSSITYVMRDGHLVPREPLLCPFCDKEVREESKFEGVPSFNTFDSLSKEDKKRVIMKRNEKVKKQDQELHDYYQAKALGLTNKK